MGGAKTRAQEPAMRQGDTFSHLFKELKKLVEELDAEQVFEDKKYDTCRANIKTTAAETDENSMEMSQLEVLINADTDSIAAANTDIAELEAALDALKKAATDAEEERTMESKNAQREST